MPTCPNHPDGCPEPPEGWDSPAALLAQLLLATTGAVIDTSPFAGQTRAVFFIVVDDGHEASATLGALGYSGLGAPSGDPDPRAHYQGDASDIQAVVDDVTAILRDAAAQHDLTVPILDLGEPRQG